MCFCLKLFTLPKSKIRLEAENAILRRQLIVLERKIQGRVCFTNSDRLFFIWLYRWFPSILDALRIIRPETLVRWHRDGFRRYWRWKSRSAGGRPQIDADLRASMHPADAPPFQNLRKQMETEWVPAMQALLDIPTEWLPALWDADFLYGPKAADGCDSYVLCEINVSSVAPYPDSAAPKVAEATLAGVRANRKGLD